MTTGTVAVTGATGFLASHIVKQLLESGYKVHGTVRSLTNKSKYEFLFNLPNAKDNLKLFEADLGKEGSFDEVVQGCEVVMHVASPFFFGETDPQKELVDPAVNGTLTLLRSAQKAKSVRRVVVTSSVVAVYDPKQVQKGKLITEEQWNTESTLTYNAYWFSKTQAEKAAWNFLKTENPHFDLVTLNPSLIIGEVLSDVKSLKEMNTSNAFLGSILNGVKKGEAVPNYGYGFVHVHDIARAHLLTGFALNNPKVSNQRFLVTAESHTFPEITRKSMKLYPKDFEGVDPNTIKIDGDVQAGIDGLAHFDNSKLVQLFPEFKYAPIDVQLRDTIDNLKDLKFF